MELSSAHSDEPLDEESLIEGAVQLGGLAAGLYGPDGSHKLVVGGAEPVIANDLQELFDALEIDHPGALLSGNAAVQQKEAVGDGSTGVVLLVGAFANRAEELLADGLHRSTIAKGFHRSKTAALDAMSDLATSVEGLDDPRGASAVRTALGESGVSGSTVRAIHEAATLVAAARDGNSRGIGIDHLRFRHVPNSDDDHVEVVRGLFLDREPVTPNTPREFDDARVAVIGGGKRAGQGIEERELRRSGGSKGKGRTEVSVNVDSPSDLEEIREHERADVAKQVQVLVDADVDVVFTTMGISDRAIAELDRAGITAFRSLQAAQARRVARTVGASVVMELTELAPEDVGTAGRVRVETIDDDTYVRIDDCPASELATVVVSGPLREGTAARERDLTTAILTGRDILEGARVVPGGGGIWTRLAAAVRTEARTVPDRTSIVMEAYADALEDLPRTIARNAGADSIDVRTELRAGGSQAVFDHETGAVRPAGETGPFDLASVVEATVQTASEVAIQLVRIDDVIPASDGDDEPDKEYNFQPDPERDVP